jgi:hypothetical protein
MTEAIESTAEDIDAPEPTRALAVVPPAPAYAVTPNVNAGELVARLNVIREASETAMKDGVDYGRIPGVDKPTLLKPGAEKLGVLFQLDIQLANEQSWGPGDHLTVVSRATVYHAPTGARLGYGEGLCTTRERKYGKRKQERTCPACGVAAIIKGKAGVRRRLGLLQEEERVRREVPRRRPGHHGAGGRGGREPGPAGHLEHGAEDGREARPRGCGARGHGRVGAVHPGRRDLGAPPAPPEPPAPVREDIQEVKALGRRHKLKVREWRNLLRGAGVEVAEKANVLPLIEALTPEQAEAMLGVLRGPLPTGESDVPADAGDFTHPPGAARASMTASA